MKYAIIAFSLMSAFAQAEEFKPVVNDAKYSSYFTTVSSKDELYALAKRAQPAAAANNDIIYIDVNPADGTYRISTKEMQNAKPLSGFALYDSEGSDLGRNLAIAGMSVKYAGNSKMTVYGTKGFGSDYPGAFYENANISNDTYTSLGNFNLAYSYTEYGGDKGLGVQKTRAERLDASFSRALGVYNAVEFGLTMNKNHQSLDDFDFTDDLRYTSAHAKFSRQYSVEDVSSGWSITHERGLDSARGGNIKSFNGIVSTGWHSTTLEASVSKGPVTITVGHQETSENAPSSARAYIGGPGRGSSFKSGYETADSATWYDVKYQFQPIHNVSPWVSINGGSTPNETVTSLQLGASTNWKGTNIRGSVNQDLQHSNKIINTKFMLSMQKSF